MTRSLGEHRTFNGGAIACAVLLLALGARPAPVTAEPITANGGSFAALTSADASEALLLFNATRFTEGAHAWYLRIDAPEAAFTRPAVPSPIEAGASVNLSAHLTWTDAPLWYGILGCCDELEARSTGSITVTGGDGVIEFFPSQFGSGTFLARAPFSFTAIIHALDVTTSVPIFSETIQGQGTASFIVDPEFPHLFAFHYGIEPIPEPATLVLLGMGAAGLAARRGLTRRRQQAP